MSSNSVLPSLFKDVFREVEAIVADEGKLSDDALLALMSTFGPTLERALAIVDKPNSICQLESPIGRKAVQVTGTSKGVYTLFPEENWCPCPAFQFYVLGPSRSEITCKHVLAAWLSRILGKTRCLTITEETMTTLLSSMLLGSENKAE